MSAVHQLLPSFAQGDAIGNQVRWLRALFQRWGYASDIFAGRCDRGSQAEARPAEALAESAGEGDVVLVHHSIRSGLLPLLRRVRARKVVLFHNVTPAHFFAPYEPEVAKECDAGREELRALTALTQSAYAFTEFSAQELRETGFTDVGVLPFPIDWDAFDVPPDPAMLERLGDGRVNVLYVGRVEPNKRVDEVLRVFSALQRLYVPHSRLVLAGHFEPGRPYGRHVRAVLQQLCPEEVLLLGKVSRESLSACYARAHVYLSMSAHEGFGVPLVEAMHREVPVVAYAAAAVPETLGGAGVCVRSDNPIEVARVIAVVATHEPLRRQLLEGQARRLRTLSASLEEQTLKTLYTRAIQGR